MVSSHLAFLSVILYSICSTQSSKVFYITYSRCSSPASILYSVSSTSQDSTVQSGVQWTSHDTFRSRDSRDKPQSGKADRSWARDVTSPGKMAPLIPEPEPPASGQRTLRWENKEKRRNYCWVLNTPVECIIQML